MNNATKQDVANFDDAVVAYGLEKTNVLFLLILPLLKSRVFQVLKRGDWTLSKDWTLHRYLYEIKDIFELFELRNEGVWIELYKTPKNFEVVRFNSSYQMPKKIPEDQSIV